MVVPLRELLPGYPALRAAAHPELPQKDDLCGPFWTLAVLRALQRRGVPVQVPGSQEEAADAAGAVRLAGAESLPPRQPSRPPEGELPVTEVPAQAGTTARGLARAIRRFAGTADAGVLPLCSAGSWSTGEVVGAVRAATRHDALLLANVATARYRFGARQAWEVYFSTGDAAAMHPSPWKVGHFAAIGGLVCSPVATAVLVHDSYPLTGLLDAEDAGSEWEHLQPAEAFAAALTRPGLPPGGLLAVGSAAALGALREEAGALGLHPDWWEEPPPGEE
ncbi:DUF6885 family protein [Sediminivirga luteola]|uniref:Uncharacterized protein n=1 Tax=Sediminivirga luteola TaxID=1774748 RepID=A0A8J2TVG4_9MICO|nr:hypothetical protein [Sediminivirga luteola]GGA03487.1 hypothetical protein GCM10011333_02780 [Sediminivirga luteola]